jgi:hypothetical protein
MPHFSLVTTDSDVLGAMELARPDWPIGSIIYRGDKPNLRVVDVLATEDDDEPERFTVIVVEAADLKQRRAMSGG